jgi:hypothetical protein
VTAFGTPPAFPEPTTDHQVNEATMNVALICRIAAIAVLIPHSLGCVISSTTGSAAHPDAADNWLDIETDSDSEGPLAIGVAPTAPADHLLTQSHVTVLQPDAGRMAVRFESPKGETGFIKQVAVRYDGGDAVKLQSSGGIPLLYGQEELSVLSKNAYYNEQVGLADQDRDGLISNHEAQSYGQRLGAPLTE